MPCNAFYDDFYPEHESAHVTVVISTYDGHQVTLLAVRLGLFQQCYVDWPDSKSGGLFIPSIGFDLLLFPRVQG